MSGLSDGHVGGAEAQLVLLEKQINQSNDDYTSISAALEISVRNLNQFADWTEAVSHLQKLISIINAGIRELREPIQTSNISLNEEQLLRNLGELKGANNLLRLRQKMADISDDEFWLLLRNMSERQLIEVTLKAQ